MQKQFEIYQLFPNKGYLMHSYLIKTPNNKIVIIDGGNMIYMEKAFLPWAIRGILGLNEKDYFEVDAWFLSHGHNDHYGELLTMLKEYDENSNYKIKNFYFDFPDFANTKFSTNDYGLDNLELLKKGLDRYAEINGIKTEKRFYDQLNGAVINSEAVKKGLTITVDGIDFEILMTYDLDDDDQVNGNSTIIKVVASSGKSKTCLFLNDASEVSGQRFLRTYNNKVKCDIVQMAHHGQAGVLKDVYDAVDASLRLWPTPSWVWTQPDKYRIGEVRGWFGTDETKNTPTDFVGCLYEKYPTDPTSVEEWKECCKYMKIVIDIE